jgi:hypothetical protein
VERFLSEIDFFVYFTHPLWQESFGRAVAEAVAAGKLVITDPATADTFSTVAADSHDVEGVIARFLADPESYRAAVRRSQAELARWSPQSFRDRVLSRITGAVERDRPLAPLVRAGGSHAGL